MSDSLPVRSSVASRRTTTSNNPHHPFQPPTPILNPTSSSWIRRLGLKSNPPPPPPPPIVRSNHQQQSLLIRRPLGLHDEGVHHDDVAAQFGPYRVASTARLTPLDHFQQRQQLTSGITITTTRISPFFQHWPAPDQENRRSREHVVPREAAAAWVASTRRGVPQYDHFADHAPNRPPPHDLRGIHYGLISNQNEGEAPSSINHQDEPFSYWTMGKFRRDTTTSVSPIAIDFGRKRIPISTEFLPLKLRKLSGAI